AHTDDVVLGKLLRGLARQPVRGGEEDAVTPDDRARLILVLAGVGLSAGQRDLPQHVRAVLAAPGQRQSLLVRNGLSGRPAPARPVSGTESSAEQQTQQQDRRGRESASRQARHRRSFRGRKARRVGSDAGRFYVLREGRASSPNRRGNPVFACRLEEDGSSRAKRRQILRPSQATDGQSSGEMAPSAVRHGVGWFSRPRKRYRVPKSVSWTISFRLKRRSSYSSSTVRFPTIRMRFRPRSLRSWSRRSGVAM